MEDGLSRRVWKASLNPTPQTREAGVPPAMSPMPKVHAMFRQLPEGDAVLFLLLDTLNTEPQDQVYAHREVAGLPRPYNQGRAWQSYAGLQSCAVQGFTTDTSVLLAALNDKQSGIRLEGPFFAQSQRYRR